MVLIAARTEFAEVHNRVSEKVKQLLFWQQGEGAVHTPAPQPWLPARAAAYEAGAFPVPQLKPMHAPSRNGPENDLI